MQVKTLLKKINSSVRKHSIFSGKADTHLSKIVELIRSYSGIDELTISYLSDGIGVGVTTYKLQTYVSLQEITEAIGEERTLDKRWFEDNASL